MPTINERVDTLSRDVSAIRASQRGYRPDTIQWVLNGNGVKYGNFVQVHTDKTTIRIHDGTALTGYTGSDPTHVNPDKVHPNTSGIAIYYANVALVGGIGYLSDEEFVVLDDTGWPSATYSRYDIVYLYFSSDGTRSIGVAEGTPTTGVPTDPSIPVGALSIARLEIDDTGIITVTDTRVFI